MGTSAYLHRGLGAVHRPAASASLATLWIALFSVFSAHAQSGRSPVPAPSPPPTAPSSFAGPIVAPLPTALPAPSAAATASSESKAELLYHIAKFIQWPEASYRGTRGQFFTFAILGEDDLAGVLASWMSTKTVDGRQVFVRCVRRPEDARGCQILFIARSEEPRIPQILAALQRASVLTVADVEGFARRGGMVDFLMDQERVRFSINLASAERARLRISAKLLSLASIVEDGN